MKPIYQFMFIFLYIGWVAAVSQKCIKCNSKLVEQNCINTNGTILSSRCERPDTCYTRVVDGVIYRGCSEEVEPKVLRNCGPDADCQVCSEDDCNAGLFPPKRLFCHMCDDSTDCKMKKEGTPIPCLRYKQDDKCIVRKKGDNVVRQCLSDYEDCSKESSSCKICDSHGCNHDEYNHAISLKNSIIFVFVTCFMTRLF